MNITGMNVGWAFAFALVVGIPIVAILSSVVGSWLRYRYRRAALDTLKSYAADGREPPEALIKALTPGPKPTHDSNEWDWDWDWGWGHDPDEDTESPAQANAGDRAEARRHRLTERAEWLAERKRGRWRRRHSAVYSWQHAIFWVTLAVGFWVAGEYAATGDLQHDLTIISYILGAVAFGSLLSAILTTVVRLNGRRPD